MRLPHELFVGDWVVVHWDAGLVTRTAADDVLLLNLHYLHRGFVILLFHCSIFYEVVTHFTHDVECAVGDAVGSLDVGCRCPHIFSSFFELFLALITCPYFPIKAGC